MIFWLAAAALVVAVAFFLLRALTPKPEASGAADFDVAFYHHQQIEIERQSAVGQISADEARHALAEAGRRLLAAKAAEAPATPVSQGRSRLAKALVLLALPALAVPVYLAQGRPGLPAMPYASRPDLNRADEDLARLIARLDAHLADSPDDARGYEVAFPVYMQLGRFDSAINAAERLIALKGETPERLTALAEALIFSQRGQVGEAALAAVEKALAGDPSLTRARFYKGLAAEQAGRADEARSIWAKLAAELPDGVEKTTVLGHVARLEGRPASDAAAAIAALPEAERRQAILGMVEGLAARLAQGGGAPEEWQRLIRARATLGDRDGALAALSAARSDLKGREGLDRIETLAKDLGLAGGAQ